MRSTIGEVGFVKTFGHKSGGCPQRSFYRRAKNKAVETLFVPKTQLGLDKFHNGIRNSSKALCKGAHRKLSDRGKEGFGLELVMPYLFFAVPKNSKGFSYYKPLKMYGAKAMVFRYYRARAKVALAGNDMKKTRGVTFRYENQNCLWGYI